MLFDTRPPSWGEAAHGIGFHPLPLAWSGAHRHEDQKSELTGCQRRRARGPVIQLPCPRTTLAALARELPFERTRRLLLVSFCTIWRGGPPKNDHLHEKAEVEKTELSAKTTLLSHASEGNQFPLQEDGSSANRCWYIFINKRGVGISLSARFREIYEQNGARSI